MFICNLKYEVIRTINKQIKAYETFDYQTVIGVYIISHSSLILINFQSPLIYTDLGAQRFPSKANHICFSRLA